MAQSRGGSSHLKRSGLKVYLSSQNPRLEVDYPTSNDLIKQKTLTVVPSHFGFLLIADIVKLTTKNNHHIRYPEPIVAPFSRYLNLSLGFAMCSLGSTGVPVGKSALHSGVAGMLPTDLCSLGALGNPLLSVV